MTLITVFHFEFAIAIKVYDLLTPYFLIVRYQCAY